MEAIRSVLRLFECWSVVTVVSDDNVADKPSRNKLATTLHARKTFDAVEKSKNGRKSGIIRCEVATVKDRKMRHIEYEGDEDHENLLIDVSEKEKFEAIDKDDESDEDILV